MPVNYQPIIIIGAARSGTNMLRDILTQLPDSGTWPCDEINYIWRHINTTCPIDEFGVEQATPSVQTYIRHQFAKLAQKQKLSLIVEKTCANSLRVAFVNQIFPTAKFIFIVRDGRDVTASALKRWNAPLDLPYILRKSRFVPVSDIPYYGIRYVWNHVYRLVARKKRLAYWGPRFTGMDEMLQSHSLAEVCAAQWAVSVSKAEQDLATLEPKRVHRVQYEDFISQPVDNMVQLTQFLGVKLEIRQAKQMTENVSVNSIGQWKTQLDPETQQLILPLLQVELQRYGYI